MLPAEPGVPNRRNRTGQGRPERGRHRHRRSDTVPVTAPPYGPYPATGRDDRDADLDIGWGYDDTATPTAFPQVGEAGVPRQRSGTPLPRYTDVWGYPAPDDAPAPDDMDAAEPTPPGDVRPDPEDAPDRPRAGWDTPATAPRTGWFPRDPISRRPPRIEPAPTELGRTPGRRPILRTHRRVRVLIAALLVPCATAVLVGVALLWPAWPLLSATLTTQPGDAIVDARRWSSLLWLAAALAVGVLLLGRWRGVAALAAVALSFAVLLVFVLPSILAGHDPLAVAVVGSCLIMFAGQYLTYGLSARTSTAILGALLSLGLIGALGSAFAAATDLTGLDNRTSDLIASVGAGVDARGLLLAGVIIGALGVLADVTATRTGAVFELRRTDPQLGGLALFRAAMRIGRDQVAKPVNTLVMAYTGASLPLLLLFTLSGQSLAAVLTAQDVATEVVRTLVGSIGLVASVPITTALAAVVASREPRKLVTAGPAFT